MGATAWIEKWRHRLPAADGRAWFWTIFLTAAVVRVAIILVRKTYLQIEHVEPASVALSLLHNGTFANAYCSNSGPTAHTGPIYVWILTPIFVLFGEDTAAQLATEVMSTFWAAAVYMLLPLLTETLAIGRAPGIVAGLLGALLPFNFWTETKGSFEQPVAACLLVLVFILLTRLTRVHKPDIPSMLPAIAIGSVMALTSSMMIPPLGFLLLATMVRLDRGAAVRLAVLFAVGLTLFLLPWGYRNHKELGKWIFTRSNFGLELWLSNNDRASADYYVNMERIFPDMHPSTTLEQCAKVSAVGEVAYHAAAMRKAQDWIAANPKHFMALVAERAYLFWIPTMRRPVQTLISLFLPTLGIAGLLLLFRQQPWSVFLLAGVAFSYQLIFLLVQIFARYSYPVQWVLWVGVGVLVHAWFRRLNEGAGRRAIAT